MQILTSLKRPVIAQGIVSYNQRSRCNNIIRLKKKIIKEFPDLIHSKIINYKAELWKSYDDLEERVIQIRRRKTGIPILLFLYKNDDQTEMIKENEEIIEHEEVNEMGEMNPEDLEQSKEILRRNMHLLSDDTKELLKLVGVRG